LDDNLKRCDDNEGINDLQLFATVYLTAASLSCQARFSFGDHVPPVNAGSAIFIRQLRLFIGPAIQ
jgi:hypothetical protein